MPARPKAREEPTDPFDPFQSPSRRMVALAYLALPIVVDRLGGSVTVSEDEMKILQDRYGGRVGVTGERTANGVWTIRLVPMEPRDPDPMQ